MEALRKEIAEKETDLQQIRDSNKQVKKEFFWLNDLGWDRICKGIRGATENDDWSWDIY